VAKQLFPLTGAAGMTVLRTLFAAVILLILWQPWKIIVSKQSFKAIAAYGLSLGFMNLLFYYALQRIPLGIAVTLEFTGPLAVALFSSKKKLDILWAFMAGLGIWLILPGSQTSGALDLAGILLAIGAGVFWALYIIFGQKAGKDVHSGRATALGMCFAALAALPFGIVQNGDQLTNLSLWPMGLLVAVLSSAIPYNFEMMALKNIPRKTFGILMSMEPVIATLMGFLFLKEALSTVQVFAMLCVILASAGSAATA
jgi:inner membrane transporter RhtA